MPPPITSTSTKGVDSNSAIPVTDSAIVVTTPSHAVGSVNVVVTNPDGQSGTLVNGFTFSAALRARCRGESISSGGIRLTIRPRPFRRGPSST